MATGGKKVVGSWQLERRLGVGSFASVFLARSVRDAEVVVAVKAISRSKLNRKLEKNLQQEIRILERLQHENIVRLFETHESQKHIYLVMEFCAGGDLHVMLRKRGAFPEHVAQALMQQLARGMHYLWSRNLIHRDLKPQNLLLTGAAPTVVLKIADFGFATQLAEAAMADTMCGSPLYMAPEVLDARPYDSKADLWSAGAILFEMLLGKPPYTGASPRALLRNIQQHPFRFPCSGGRAPASPEAKSLLEGMLVADPAKRMDFETFYGHPFLASEATAAEAAEATAAAAEPWEDDAPAGTAASSPDTASHDSSLPGSDGSTQSSFFNASDMLFKDSSLADDHTAGPGSSNSSGSKGRPKTGNTKSEDAWEIVPEAGKSAPRPRPASASDSGRPAPNVMHTRTVRLAGELGERAAALGEVARTLWKGAGPVADAVRSVAAAAAVEPHVAALQLLHKALHVLAQATRACESCGSSDDANVLAAAKHTRGELVAAFGALADLSEQVEAFHCGEWQDDKTVSPVEGLMVNMALALLGQAACAEREGRVSEAEDLLGPAQNLVELLCADPRYAVQPARHQLLGLRALVVTRSSAVRKLRTSSLRHTEAQLSSADPPLQ